MKKMGRCKKYKKIFFWKSAQLLLAFVLIAHSPQNVFAGSLLYSIDQYLSGGFPVAQATLTLYDQNGSYIDSQSMDPAGLLANGYVLDGNNITFNGSLTFPDIYPYVYGATGGQFASVHDFSIDSSTYSFLFSGPPDLVTMQIDWLYSNQSITENWYFGHGDDFDNGIAYYWYGGSSSAELSYGFASFGLTFVTGIAPVPLPAAGWLLGSGFLGLIGVANRKTYA